MIAFIQSPNIVLTQNEEQNWVKPHKNWPHKCLKLLNHKDVDLAILILLSSYMPFIISFNVS